MGKKDSILSQTLTWYPWPHDIYFTFNCCFLSSRKSLPLVVGVQILGKTLPSEWENSPWRFVLRQFHPGISQSEYNKKNQGNRMPKTLTFCKRTATTTSIKFIKISVWLIYFRDFAYEMSIQYLKNVISTAFNEDDNQKKGEKEWNCFNIVMTFLLFIQIILI